jgi:hypothetical protein
VYVKVEPATPYTARYATADHAAAEQVAEQAWQTERRRTVIFERCVVQKQRPVATVCSAAAHPSRLCHCSQGSVVGPETNAFEQSKSEHVELQTATDCGPCSASRPWFQSLCRHTEILVERTASGRASSARTADSLGTAGQPKFSRSGGIRHTQCAVQRYRQVHN